MKTLGLTLLSITSLLCITACTPPLQEAVRTPPKTDFYTDSLGGEEINIVDNAEAFPMVWNGVIDSEDYFELISNLFQQSKIYSNEALKKTALSLIDRYEKNEDLSTQVNFKKTPFFDILVAKAEPQIRSTIIEIETNLPKDMEKLKVMINDLNAMFQWPEKPSIEQSIIWIQSFMSEITLGVPKLHLNSRVESALITQLKKQSSESIDALQTSAKKLRAEKTLTGAITVIEELVSKLEFSMDESTTKLIKSGKSLGKKIDKYKNSEGALEAILEIWLMLDKNGRKEHIKPVSSDLYDFLNDKSDSTVRCIITPGCFSPWQDFLTDFFIKPKLEDYGLGKLRRELNAGTYEYTVQALEEQVSLVLPSLHKQIVDKIAESVEHERQGLNEITADIPAFVGLSLTKWGENNFDKPPARLYSYEKPSVEVKLKSNYPNYLVEVKAAGSPSLSSTNSAVIGSSLAAYSGLLSSGIKDNKTYIRVFVNQLNKVLGFGGIEYKPNSISVGLMRSFESEKEKFNLPLAPNSPLTFVLVDNLSLKSPYTVQHEISTLNIGAKAQSQLLNGLLDLMDYMKDWQKNDFDNFLGERDAGELFSKDGEPVEKIGQKIFPKDQFFALLFAHVGNSVKNITKGKTPFILFPESGQRLWANEIDQATLPVTMAGVVDIKNGERSDIIRSQNVSRWILTLSKFLQKMDGIENTQAVELTQRDSSGKNPIESVLEGKEDVEKLIIALGNLLSSQMMNEGMVYEAVKVKDLSDISRKYNLMDQLLAIDALLSIHELTKMQNYFASAMDIYGSLRKSLNPKTNFFEVGDDKVSNPVLTSYLTRTMSHVLPYLKPKDQQSLKDQIKIWNYKLQKIN